MQNLTNSIYHFLIFLLFLLVGILLSHVMNMKSTSKNNIEESTTAELQVSLFVIYYDRVVVIPELRIK